MGTKRKQITNGLDNLNLSLLRRLLRAAEQLSPSPSLRPSEETIWAYLIGTASRSQRQEMYSALADSASFRQELLALADEFEDISVERPQIEDRKVDVLVIEQGSVSGPGEIVVFTLKGLIPKSHADVLGEELDRVIAEGVCRIVVDLSRVVYIGSAGWLAFLGRVIQLRKRGGDIKLAGLRAHVRAIFELVRLDDFLDAYPALEDAISELRSSGPPGP